MKAIHAMRRQTPTRFISWCGLETQRYDEEPRRGQILVSAKLGDVTCRQCLKRHRISFREADRDV